MAVTPTLNMWLRHDPNSGDNDISSFLVDSISITGEKAEIDITSFADLTAQYAQGEVIDQVSLTVQDDDDLTFAETYLLPAYQNGTDFILGLRHKDAAVGTGNPEYRFKLQILNFEHSAQRGAVRRQTYTFRSNETIRSTNGSTWTNFSDASSATVF